jgi:hypothetical protein
MSQLAEIRDAIGSLHHKSLDQRWFVSQDELKTYLSRDRITKGILECSVPDHQRQSIVDRILTGGKILFGILVWKNWQHRLMDFIEHNALDAELPLDEAHVKDIAEAFAWDFAHCAQWVFLPRPLTMEMSDYHCYFRDEEILPFIEEERLGEGTFGEVHKVSVLPSMQTIVPV